MEFMCCDQGGLEYGREGRGKGWWREVSRASSLVFLCMKSFFVWSLLKVAVRRFVRCTNR